MLDPNMLGLCLVLFLGLTNTMVEAEEAKTNSHLVNIEDVFYWRCPDLSGRKHRRGAVLEDGCHRCHIRLY